MRCCTASKFALTLAAGIAGGFMLQASISPSLALQPEGGEPSMEEMMAEMARLGAPGEHHKMLGRTVGDWDVEATFMMPGGEPMKGAGSMSCEWVLDGRFVKTDFSLPDFMGAPFQGIGYNGYDNGKQQYVGVWMDNMSTMAFVTEGEMLDDGSFVSIGPNAMGGKMKIVSRMDGEDAIVDTFYDQIEGEWVETGTMHYTRK